MIPSKLPSPDNDDDMVCLSHNFAMQLFPFRLARHDMVITTYQIVQREAFKFVEEKQMIQKNCVPQVGSYALLLLQNIHTLAII